MGDRTAIEWTDATWNPIRGCSRVSEGCRNCYAERTAARFSGPGMPYAGLAEMVDRKPRWTGKLRPVHELLTKPLGWRKPRRVFVNSMSDLFHEAFDEDEELAEFREQIFCVMAAASRHTFQVLTKRPERARAYLLEVQDDDRDMHRWERWARDLLGTDYKVPLGWDWPLANVWLGVSIENQRTADERVPPLLETPAAVRWVSYEPALGPVMLHAIGESELGTTYDALRGIGNWAREERARGRSLDWVVAGGESGPGARPAHPGWFRHLRDRCRDAGVPFFFKQWGAYGPGSIREEPGMAPVRCFREFVTFARWVQKGASWVGDGACVDMRGRVLRSGEDFAIARDDGAFPVVVMDKLGKQLSGRELDGRTWDEFPRRPPHG